MVMLEPGLEEFFCFFATLETLPELTFDCFDKLSFSRFSISANFCFYLCDGFFEFYGG